MPRSISTKAQETQSTLEIGIYAAEPACAVGDEHLVLQAEALNGPPFEDPVQDGSSSSSSVRVASHAFFRKRSALAQCTVDDRQTKVVQIAPAGFGAEGPSSNWTG